MGTFVWYKSTQKVTWSKWQGLKRLINTKWKESSMLLSDVVNMWALDQRSLSFTVIFSQLHFLGIFYTLRLTNSHYHLLSFLLNYIFFGLLFTVFVVIAMTNDCLIKDHCHGHLYLLPFIVIYQYSRNLAIKSDHENKNITIKELTPINSLTSFVNFVQ